MASWMLVAAVAQELKGDAGPGLLRSTYRMPAEALRAQKRPSRAGQRIRRVLIGSLILIEDIIAERRGDGKFGIFSGRERKLTAKHTKAKGYFNRKERKELKERRGALTTDFTDGHGWEGGGREFRHERTQRTHNGRRVKTGGKALQKQTEQTKDGFLSQ